MKAFAVIIVVCFVFLVVWTSPDFVEWREDRAAWQYQNEALKYDRAYAEFERDEARRNAESRVEVTLAPVLTTVVISTTIALIIAIPLTLALGGAGAIALFRRRMQFAYPDAAGRLPVRLADSEYDRLAAAALAAFHAVEQERARQSFAVPHSVHYAPHTATTATAFAADTGSTPVDEPAGAALPGLTDLADISFRPSVQAILLGLGPGGSLVTVAPKNLFHVALAGPTGAGKSNTARLMLSQLLTMGARVAIADPNWTEYDSESGEDWRMIRAGLCLEPAYDPAGIEEMLEYFGAELKERLELRRQGKKPGRPLFLYCDELAAIIRQDKGRGELFKELIEQGRKVSLFVIVASQDLLASTIGTSAASRENYRTAYWAGGDLHTGAAILDVPRRDLATWQPELGLSWLRSSATTPPRVVRIPRASNEGITRLLGDNAPTMDRLQPQGEAGGEAGVKTASSASQCAGGQSAQSARIVSLFRSGRSVSEIAREVFGVTGGKRWAEVSTEIHAALRGAMAEVD